MMPDSLYVFDRERAPTTALRDILANTPTFLLAGGPSTRQLDLTQLARRGIFSMAINNMAGHFRANAFVCSDPPSKFHNGIWLDPGIMKFVPLPKLTEKPRRSGLREKRSDGSFHFIRLPQDDNRCLCVKHCPNVWGFGRRTWWAYDDTFFSDPDATWGNGKDGLARTGNPTTFNTMLLALRLLYYMGSRRIFLVGVDFKMSATDSYVFAQTKPGVAQDNADCNARQYSVVNYGLTMMANAGVFQRAGLEIFNCNQNSGLRAFPYVPYDLAIKDALKNFPPEPFDLSGWYEKDEDSK